MNTTQRTPKSSSEKALVFLEMGFTGGDTPWGKHLLWDVVFPQIPLKLVEGLGDIEVNER